MSAEVYCRSRSPLLERVLVDFGADHSFDEAVKKVQEHYGVTVASSTTRLDVEKHARVIEQSIDKYVDSQKIIKAEVVIGETDGSMVPIVSQKESEAPVTDKRKNKKHEWREARLALARAHGSVSPAYRAAICSTDEAGEQLASVVKEAGEGEKTKIHCLGDGALWVAEQVEQNFGSKATFTLDFYHVSEYLAAAATCCHPETPRQWMHEQQALLKSSLAGNVLENLKKHPMEVCTLKDKCLALKCYNYLSKRLAQLDYKAAIDAGLPIGSGEIESGHRSVIQKRLKISGAWWTVDNANSMLALRTLRINGHWRKYWGNGTNTGAPQA